MFTRNTGSWRPKLEFLEANQFPLLETLSICNNQIQNLTFHIQRMNRVRAELYCNLKPLSFLDLENQILRNYTAWVSLQKAHKELNPQCENLPLQVKTRVLYGETLGPMDFQWYIRPKYRGALIVAVTHLSYSFKWADRSCFDSYTKHVPKDLYPLFSKHGLLTDGLTSNIVIPQADIYLTPKTPLLRGTMREYLLQSSTIIEADIHTRDLQESQQVILINALNPLGNWSLPVLYS
jgi:4-amino-4-deoxychorismate lyase